MAFTTTQEFAPDVRGADRTLIRDSGSGTIEAQFLLNGSWVGTGDALFEEFGAYTVRQGRVQIRMLVTGDVTYDYQ